MPKRKEAETNGVSTPTSKRRKSTLNAGHDPEPPLFSPAETPSKLRSILKVNDGQDIEATPRSVRKVLFSENVTPKAQNLAQDAALESPLTKTRRLDSSARRKSAKKVLEPEEQDDAVTTGESALAGIILANDGEVASIEDEIVVNPDTPSKKTPAKGRPRGKRKEKSPTPPDDMQPHELYFFLNRTGANKTSSNTLPSGVLLNHEEYFAHIKRYTDPHQKYVDHLVQIHTRSFDQWEFELECGFSICLYGYGSKRHLLNSFAEHMSQAPSTTPTIIIVNGYNDSLVPKDMLTTIAEEVLPADLKLSGQPLHLADAILSHLTDHPPKAPIRLIINSLDGVSLRKPSTQLLISRLAAHPSITLIASVDTPTFPLLWPLPLLSSFRFLFHDTTTFHPFDAEIDTVDEVNNLLGRSGRRVGGKDGVTFVLRSLPENAQNLFRVLVAEQLSLIEAGIMAEDSATTGSAGEDDDVDFDPDDETLFGFDEEEGHAMDLDADDTPARGRGKGGVRKRKQGVRSAEQIAAAAHRRGERHMLAGVEYRALYRKAVEDFVCSSEMGFRTLLKEFYDHQIVESRKDALLGGERLVVPFGRVELEALLEELI